MPEISRFYGIVIQIYYGDHPPPHFHALYAGHTAKIDINALSAPLRAPPSDREARPRESEIVLAADFREAPPHELV